MEGKKKKMKISAFGKILKKMRIDSSELLGQMAKRLEISPAYLSAIESGDRNVTDEIFNKICTVYSLSDEQKEELNKARIQTQGEINVVLGENKTIEGVETAVLFARDFSKLSEEQLAKMKKLLEKFNKDNSGR